MTAVTSPVAVVCLLTLVTLTFTSSFTAAEKMAVPCWRNKQCNECRNTGRQGDDVVCCQGCVSAPKSLKANNVCTCFMEAPTAKPEPPTVEPEVTTPSSALNLLPSAIGVSFAATTCLLFIMSKH